MMSIVSAESVIAPQIRRLLSASQLEEAVLWNLQHWFPTYLAEMARQLGVSRNSLPQPQNYTTRNSFDTEAGEKVPKIVVLAPGLLNPPRKNGTGVYNAIWRLGVGIAASGKDEQSANLRVKAYAAAIRGIVVQERKTLGGRIDGIVDITWIDESYDDIPISNQHQLFKGASVWFAVDINNVLSKVSGPDQITVDPIPAWHEADEVYVDVEKVEEGESV
jgi:hypothetical protein